MSNIADLKHFGFTIEEIKKMTEAQLTLWADTVQFKLAEDAILSQLRSLHTNPFADPKSVDKVQRKLKLSHKKLLHWYLGKPDEDEEVIQSVYGKNAVRSKRPTNS